MSATQESVGSILAFWFGPGDDATVAAARSRLWWGKDDATDRAMATRFAGCIDAAATGALDAWAATPAGRLALILLTDQFPRNIHRGTPRAFALDARARRFCMEGLTQGVDRLLRPIERVFFYLPLEHSESMPDQERAVALFAQLLADVPADQRAAFAGYHDFALRHREVVERFGRFPHRNAILGRTSTPAEIAFLQQKGSSF
ncbi:MAG TPA: DUF924 family protein [Noviherbaspirillum sp.]|jgi:uncharacterized protein (DUF924 family)|uniref:DUF924 family protein n=1 Tax=Noviherbaspirillum sp. TaxID=1926288 RepID=UPI002F91F12A